MAWRGLTPLNGILFQQHVGHVRGNGSYWSYILNEEGFHYLCFSLAPIASAEPPDCDCIIDGPLFYYSEKFQVLLVLKPRM